MKTNFRKLIDKVKNDISVQINTIVETNLDNSDYCKELADIARDEDRLKEWNHFNKLCQDSMNDIKLISFEELLDEFKNTM